MSRVPGLSDQLIDDAAVFPPGNAPVDRALRDHAAWRGSAYEGLVGPLLLPASAVHAARNAADPTDVLSLGLIGDTGLEGLIAARDAMQDDAWFSIVQFELALRSPDDPPGAVKRLLSDLPFTAPTYIELPVDIEPEPVLAIIAEDGAERAKFRCGPTLVPTHLQLATFLLGCVRYRVPFKLTAGLHHALPTVDEESGVEQHGFLNTLAATSAAIDGAEASDVVAVLKHADAERLVELLEATGAAAMRQLYRSFGSCSITEPYEEFAALSLLPEGEQ